MISRLKEGDTEGNQQNPRNVIVTLKISIMEDEFHFLMICTTYESKRKIMLDAIHSSLPNVKVLDAKEQFIWLMSQEDVACTQEIAKVITQCMKLREHEH